jgi:hypothetical protein
LRFVPTPDASGSASLTWLAWDRTDGTAGASGFIIPGTDGAFAFSAASATVTLTVLPSKQPPAWYGKGAVLTAVLPNTTPPGDTVASVFGAFFQDGANSVSPGIAVTALTGMANGTWQFSPDGTNWSAIGTVSPAKALLLSAGYRLRFVPKAGFLGTVKLTAVAWEGSTGTAGGTANVHGSTAFSMSPLTATCLINTAPTLTG